MTNVGHGNPSCPHLGLEDDPDTSLAFPSIWNTCHRSRRVVCPSLDHQTEYCLSENHRNCVAFPAEQATSPLPHHLRAPRARRSVRGGYQSLALLLTGILVLAGLGWRLLAHKYSLPVVTKMPTLTRIASMTPSATHTAFLTSTLVPTATGTPISRFAGQTVSKHQLEQPIGSDYRFVIHRVLDGENTNQYAAKYNTSIEAIVMVNYKFQTPLLAGALVIIPVGFTEVSNLPAFEPYQVSKTDSLLKVLALRLSVSLEDLRYYNAIGPDESLQPGDWLLIPRPRPLPQPTTVR